ncbi:MAG: hypothetical protein J0L92_32860 [Deltaproteobacteria bacterium]|nr:hypothetical protein [Deltaproteobacteria bacterium]
MPLRSVLSVSLLSLVSCGSATTSSSSSTVPNARIDRFSLTTRHDARVESLVASELDALMSEDAMRSARVVVLSVDDGSILAAAGRDRGGANDALATDEVRSHGSTGKTFTIAIALEAGVVHDGDSFDGAPITRGDATITDHATHEAMSLEDVMAFSSNVGVTHIADALGADRLFAGYERLGLGHRVPVGARADALASARIAYGADLSATSLEVARGYLVIARGGTYPSGERALDHEAATRTLALLELAVSRDDATGHRASIDGVRVAGKTGTMPIDGGTYGVFVGVVPADAPAYVVLVGVERDGEGYSGGTLAAPAFARVARAVLAR